MGSRDWIYRSSNLGSSKKTAKPQNKFLAKPGTPGNLLSKGAGEGIHKELQLDAMAKRSRVLSRHKSQLTKEIVGNKPHFCI